MLYHLLLFVCIAHIALADTENILKEGAAAFKQNKFDEAEQHFKQAAMLIPHEPTILFNLAQCYIKNNKIQDAIDLLLKIIELNPQHIKAYTLLLELYKKNGNKLQIESLYEQLNMLQHNDTHIHLTLARHYKNKELFDQAINHYLQALKFEPDNKNITFELAILYTLIGQTAKAIALYDEILRVHPHNGSVIYNKGYAFKMQGDCDEAITCYKKALALNNEYNEAHFALGMAYLNKGDFEQGWKQHTRFLKQVDRNGDKIRSYLAQNNTAGKTILLKPEGGLGDSINFIRYAKVLKSYGFKVVVAIQKPLYKLCQRCPGIDLLVQIGDLIPHVHDHTTLMSIPAILYSHEHKLPTFEPYIFPDPDLVHFWGKELNHDKNLKVGICWEASVYNDSSRPPAARRGMPLEALYILSEIEQVTLYSLQQEDGTEQLKQLPPQVKIHVFDETFDKKHGSFMDTAAVMQHLDLIISVDTAIAHLAGAMGKPVWLLLPWATDWRWLAHQTTSPWYPTMRIFQQPEPFDWESPVNEVFWALNETVKLYKHRT